MTRNLKGALTATVAGLALAASLGLAQAQDKTTITFQRFFGACDADYGTNTDLSKSNGECGIITTLINKFNAESKDAHVNVNIVEWPGYDQLNAQLASGDAPTLVTIHQAVLSDYSSRNLIDPLDDALAGVGIKPDAFTPASRQGVTKDGKVYALPIDNHPWLWHINLNLFKQAGLLNADGSPMLPKNKQELLAQAKQFQDKTGKPYILVPTVNETAAWTRTFDTLLYQQNIDFFKDPTKMDLTNPGAKDALEFLKAIFDQGSIKKDQDYAATTASFFSGDAGVYWVGPWLVGDYSDAAKKPGNALSNGYTVVPFPQLYPGKDAVWTDGHSIAMPHADLDDKTKAAAVEFLKFMWDHDGDWARTGHVAASQAVIDSKEFQSLPNRGKLLDLPKIATALPEGVKRQFGIQQIENEEVEAAVMGQKPVDQALTDMGNRVNELLANAQ